MFVFDSALSRTIRRRSRRSGTAEAPAVGPLSPQLLDRMQRYWQAADYLTVGQVCLSEHPLRREPSAPTPLAKGQPRNEVFTDA